MEKKFVLKHIIRSKIKTEKMILLRSATATQGRTKSEIIKLWKN
jgi:hypothetical protein